LPDDGLGFGGFRAGAYRGALQNPPIRFFDPIE
jgi:hypothetical protein